LQATALVNNYSNAWLVGSHSCRAKKEIKLFQQRKQNIRVERGMLEQLKNFTSQSASSKVSCHQKQLQWGNHSLSYRCQLHKRSHHSITTTSEAETCCSNC